MMIKMESASGGGGGNVVTGTGTLPSQTEGEFTVNTGLSTINHFMLVSEQAHAVVGYSDNKFSSVGAGSSQQSVTIGTTSVYTPYIKAISGGDVTIKLGYYFNNRGEDYVWYAD